MIESIDASDQVNNHCRIEIKEMFEYTLNKYGVEMSF